MRAGDEGVRRRDDSVRVRLAESLPILRDHQGKDERMGGYPLRPPSTKLVGYRPGAGMRLLRIPGTTPSMASSTHR